jgi:hypothetical protein
MEGLFSKLQDLINADPPRHEEILMISNESRSFLKSRTHAMPHPNGLRCIPHLHSQGHIFTKLCDFAFLCTNSFMVLFTSMVTEP